MSGKKGRSGRKPLLEEKSIEEITNLSADILLRWLQNKEVPTTRKVVVCKEIVLKRLPAKVEGKGFGNQFIFNTIRQIVEDATNHGSDRTAEGIRSPEALER